MTEALPAEEGPYYQQPHAEPLREVPVDDLGTAEIDGGMSLAAPPAIMDKTKFFDFFSSAFALGGNMAAMATPMRQPLQTLTRAHQLPSARPASDAIYDLAVKYDWLHWLIEEDSAMLQSLVVIGAFGTQIVVGVRAEVTAQREAREAWEDEQERREARPQQPEGQGQGNTAQPVMQ